MPSVTPVLHDIAASSGPLTLDAFLTLLKRVEGFDPDDEKKAAIRAPKDAPLFLVAGPGTGKTLCLTYRVLKLVYVDGVAPEGVLATTFTKKAARELRSRILSKGFALHETAEADLDGAALERLRTIDINGVRTGTLDSLCEEVLRDYRDAGDDPPIPTDEFVAATLMLRRGIFGTGAHKDGDFDNLVRRLKGYGPRKEGKRHLPPAVMTEVASSVRERRYQDLVDWDAWVEADPDERAAREKMRAVFEGYEAALAENGLLDFALIEWTFLQRLQKGRLSRFTDDLEVVLVDEYQDTNALQEAIYFGLAEACGGALAVVGDDDQSLYRFRGATVDLFRDFATRYEARFGRPVSPLFLTHNYRSTREIKRFVNAYAAFDPAYQPARVEGKPPLAEEGSDGLPVVTLIRPDLPTLAHDLAMLLRAVYDGGYELPDGRTLRARADGAIGDVALLCDSPKEWYGSGNDKPLLPRLLRDELTPDIPLFNPRGQDLNEVAAVKTLGGLFLECLDPDGAAAEEAYLSSDQEDAFDAWRRAARSAREADAGLDAFVGRWGRREAPKKAWPQQASALELLYALAHYVTEERGSEAVRVFRETPEGQVFLEVFTRQLTAATAVSGYSGMVLHGADDGHDERSIKHLIEYFLAPIAGGSVKINEELVEDFPRDHLNVLSIHQAKGLEFPLVVVSVGCRASWGHHFNAFRRFPKDGGEPERFEDEFRPFSALDEPAFSPRDRSFNDLIRQYFVAYSRPKQVLLLVGTEHAFTYETKKSKRPIRSAIWGCTRDEDEAWDRTSWGPGDFLTL